MERNTIKLLGFSIDTFDFESAVNYAKALMEFKKGGQVITINPEMIEYGLKNNQFADILNNADLVIPDGVGVQLALKIKGHNIQRIAGIEFSYRLIKECAKSNFPVAFIGAKPGIAAKAAENISSEIKNLNISYIQDGYFKDDNKILRELEEKQPRLVLVALGSPRQEEFIIEARKIIPRALMIGVGGSFDVWSGDVQRAPKIYQQLGIEWLYRTVKEPWRFKRIFPTLPRFLLRVLKG